MASVQPLSQVGLRQGLRSSRNSFARRVVVEGAGFSTTGSAGARGQMARQRQAVIRRASRMCQHDIEGRP
jgi:hypothetical protein